MKKLCCFLLVAVLALFAASAMADCATEGHACNCQTPDVCWECGATGVTGEITHGFANEIEYVKDAEKHYVFCCDGCGTALVEEEHYVTCGSNATACEVCGYPDATVRCEYKDVNIGDEHAYMCTGCGTVQFTAPHETPCTGGDTCVFCGAEGVTGLICHNTEVYHDAEGHWRICLACGHVDEKEEHYLLCTNGDVCINCGAAGVTGEVLHYLELKGDAEGHWNACRECDFTEEKRRHERPCDAETDACVGCGQPCEATIHPRCTGESVIAPDCVNDGVVGITCDLCGAYWEEVDKSNGECRYRDVNIGDEHAYMCPGCNTVKSVSPHEIPCTGGDTCAYCGAEGVTGPICHDYELFYDAETHWCVCRGCGHTEEKEAHRLICTDGSFCIHCGAEGVNGEVGHAGDLQGDAEGHWLVCRECGNIGEKERHERFCDAETDACLGCGLPCEATIHPSCSGESVIAPDCVNDGVVGITCDLCGAYWEEVEKSTGECRYRDVNIGDEHAYMCPGCNTVESVSPHEIPCTGGDTCVFCGATGVTGEVNHRAEEAEYDANSHWWTCLDCGEKIWDGEHHAFCDLDPTVCMACGISGVNITIYHGIDEGDLETTETEHWWNCSVCGEKAYRGAHEDADQDGMCDTCNYQMTEVTPVTPLKLIEFTTNMQELTVGELISFTLLYEGDDYENVARMLFYTYDGNGQQLGDPWVCDGFINFYNFIPSVPGQYAIRVFMLTKDGGEQVVTSPFFKTKAQALDPIVLNGFTADRAELRVGELINFLLDYTGNDYDNVGWMKFYTYNSLGQEVGDPWTWNGFVGHYGFISSMPGDYAIRVFMATHDGGLQVVTSPFFSVTE